MSNRYSDAEAQMLLIRVMLGLNPAHDPVECIRVLHEQGRAAFEALRGEPCHYAHEWRPRYYENIGPFPVPA